MSWVRGLPGWPGPLVRARLVDPAAPHRRARAAAGEPVVHAVDVLALLDTGATHSIVDLEHVANPLSLRALDTRRMVQADRGAVDLPVFELDLETTDFALPRRPLRVGGASLPGPFALLLGMDALEGTHLEIAVRDGGMWVRWRVAG